jgi:hypothetical protein
MVYLLYFFIVNSATSTKIINFDKPLCKNCIHFIPYKGYEYDNNFGKCKFFGINDIINGEIEYDYADLCRSNEFKCGSQGKYFTLEENIKMKKFYSKVNYLINNYKIYIYIIIITLFSINKK